MIVALVKDHYLRAAVRRAADRDEDVVFDSILGTLAAEVGYPRLIVTDSGFGTLVGVRPDVPVLELTRETLSAWESERRRAEEGAVDRLDHLSGCIGAQIAAQANDATWVDSALADIARVAVAPPPAPLRGFGRRILEFPAYYTDLHAMSELTRLTRGALKARFRRRGLTSPYTYMRWFRMMACAHVLSDRSVTVAVAAHRLGFTSDGNLCRTMVGLTGLRPTELRTVRGWERLIVSFAWTHLGTHDLQGWEGLGDLFEAKVA
jgi:AraC-like DNA-binding protein